MLLKAFFGACGIVFSGGAVWRFFEERGKVHLAAAGELEVFFGVPAEEIFRHSPQAINKVAGRETSGKQFSRSPTLQGSSLMAQSFFQGYLHIVFSTKGRVKFLTADVEAELFRYIAGIVKGHGAILIIGNGAADHVHLLVSFSKHTDIPKMIGEIKRSSSKLLKTKGRSLSKFAWQEGYSAFTVGHAQLDVVRNYIAGQKERHRARLFEQEMRSIYRKNGIEFDEDFVWG